MPPGDYDITGNIKAIESLKLELLQSAVSLLKNMADQRQNREDQLKNLSNILTLAYMLAARLNINLNTIDEKAAEDAKAHILKDTHILTADYSAVLRHITRRKP